MMNSRKSNDLSGGHLKNSHSSSYLRGGHDNHLHDLGVSFYYANTLQ